MTAVTEQSTDTEAVAAANALVTSDGFALNEPFPIPSKEAFEGEAFAPAYNLEKIAQELVKAHERFYFVKAARVRYLWKANGGTPGGSPTLGACQRNNPMTVYDTQYDFTIWVAADTCMMVNITRQQMYALMYHQLRHFKYDADKGKVTIQGHAFEGWADEVEHFGFWQPSIEAVAKAVQMRLSLDDDGAGPWAEGVPITLPTEQADGTTPEGETQPDDEVAAEARVEAELAAEVNTIEGTATEVTPPDAPEPGVDDEGFYDPALDKK